MDITAEVFEKATGRKPEQDDLERSNCALAGTIGHDCCGWSAVHNRPNFMLPHASVKLERLAKRLGG